MPTIRELLSEKGNEVWSISPKATVYHGLEIMAERNVGALMVIDEGQILGIFTERDYCRKVILKGKSSYNILIEELMTGNLTYLSLDDSLEVAMAVMAAKDTRYLPILENDKLVGIVTLGDVVKRMLSKQKLEIQRFETLVYGGYQ